MEITNSGLCPLCLKNKLNDERPALNSLSRRDNQTYICGSCGSQEAMSDLGYKNTLRYKPNIALWSKVVQSFELYARQQEIAIWITISREEN